MTALRATKMTIHEIYRLNVNVWSPEIPMESLSLSLSLSGVCGGAHVCEYRCVWRWRWGVRTQNLILCHTPPPGSLTGLELAHETNLAGQEALGIHLDPPQAGFPNVCHRGTRNQTDLRQADR